MQYQQCHLFLVQLCRLLQVKDMEGVARRQLPMLLMLQQLYSLLELLCPQVTLGQLLLHLLLQLQTRQLPPVHH